VDADHIAAIDNTVRKLVQAGQRPIGVGCYFSLGHSTIVVLASAAIAAAASELRGRLQDFAAIGAVVGTMVSATFLLLIAVVNVVILLGVWRSFRSIARGEQIDTAALDTLLAGRGLLARLLRPLFRAVSQSWHMYPIGFLFGLGFDTATEVGLLGIAATQAAQGISPAHIMVFPALFTAGMSLVDTSDGVLMVGVYSWAFLRPVRKLWYNLTVTAASVLVALLIGGLEAVGLLAGQFGLQGSVWRLIAALNDDLGNIGFLVIAVFLVVWATSALIFRWKKYGALDDIMPTGNLAEIERRLRPP
jgi:nickel/cobalt transporter (NiCoT) family protein